MVRRALRSLVTLAATCVACASHAQEAPPVMVLTDTVEYCVRLQHLVQDRPVRPPEVNKMLADGRRMCEHGEVRRGIFRLRNALWILHHRAPAG